MMQLGSRRGPEKASRESLRSNAVRFIGASQGENAIVKKLVFLILLSFFPPFDPVMVLKYYLDLGFDLKMSTL